MAPLPQGQGLLSEALASLDTLVARARQILREHGPHETFRGACAFQAIAWTVTEELIEPLLSQWRPQLAALEADDHLGTGRFARERAWPHQEALREDIERVRHRLIVAAGELAQVAGARSLIGEDETTR